MPSRKALGAPWKGFSLQDTLLIVYRIISYSATSKDEKENNFKRWVFINQTDTVLSGHHISTTWDYSIDAHKRGMQEWDVSAS